MPVYEFVCRKCQNTFTVEESYSRHSEHREKCPKCGSRKVEQQISPVFAKTSRKS